MFAVGPVTPLIIAEYSINRSTASLLVSLIPFTHMLLGLPSGVLVSKMGPSNGLLLAAVLASAPVLSFLSLDYSILIFLRVVYAIGICLMFPAVISLVNHWFPANELPTFNGLFVISFSLATAVSTFTVAPIADMLGWSIALSMMGIMPLLGAALWLVVGYRKADNAQGESSSRKSSSRNGIDIVGVVRDRNTMLIALADAGPYALMTAAVAWLPTFFNEVRGMTLIEAGSMMGIMSVAGTLSLIASSILVLRVRKRRPFLIVPGIVAGFAGIGSILLHDNLMMVALIAMGFACWFYLPVLITIPMELHASNPERVPIIMGALMSVGSCFSFISPITVGMSADLLGSYLPGLVLFSILSWSLAICGMLLPETGPSKDRLT
jgi:cyanate permease